MKKIIFVFAALFAFCSLLYAEDVKKESKWTGRIIPRVEVEDTHSYGEEDAPPQLWIKKVNGILKHKDYSNWTFIYEIREAEWGTDYLFDEVNSKQMYRVYPGIQYSRKFTDKLTLGVTVRDRWQYQETAKGKTDFKVNSYRIAPKFVYQITDKLDFHGEVYFMKDIFYDRNPEKSKIQRNSTGYEITGVGFTYRFSPGMYFMADYWEEVWEKEHRSKYDGDKMRHQQIRPRLALKLNEKDTLELYGRIQIFGDQVTRDDKKGKIEVKRNRYGFDFIHKIDESFTVNVGFAVEPEIREKTYEGNVKKRDWYYYTGRLVYKF